MIGTPGVSIEALAGWRATVRRLAALKECTLRLSADARKILYAFAERIEARMRPCGDLRRIADWAGKIEIGQAARIAGVLHCMEHSRPDRSPISEDTMTRALALTFYYISEAKRAFHDMASPYASAAVRVAKWIRDEQLKTISPRQICRKFGGRAEEAAAVLGELEAEGKLTRKDARTFQVEDLGEEESATEPIPEFEEPIEPDASVTSNASAKPPEEDEDLDGFPCPSISLDGVLDDDEDWDVAMVQVEEESPVGDDDDPDYDVDF